MRAFVAELDPGSALLVAAIVVAFARVVYDLLIGLAVKARRGWV